ncbi:Ubiquitin carboxyl-terminal hydrolase [Gracilaria domingensis]|nr:Ubiquitin carboxyl-terminal hydrolase [Gracilaria domingensis]
MGRRASQKAARRKGAKRQRAAEKRAERERNRLSARNAADPAAASHRLTLLREAVVRGEAPAPRGLTNLGNTCFFNAVMQNIARVATFREYFVGSVPCPGEGPLTAALRSFFVAMWDLSTTSVFNPSKLFTEVGKKNPSFRGRAQQDSHELMRVLFDGVVEEEKQRLTKVHRGILPPAHEGELSDSSSDSGTLASSTSLDEISDESPVVDDSVVFIGPLLPGESVSDVSKASSVTESVHTGSASQEDVQPPASDSSLPDVSEAEPIPAEKLLTIIERAFGGTLSSTIVCKECGTKSSVTEPFLDLQLPLVPKEERSDEKARPQAPEDDRLKSEEPETVNASEGRSSDATNFEYTELKQSAVTTTTVALPPPPPPPPLPPPPRTVRPAQVSGVSSDPMDELRQKVNPYEAEPVQENRLIVHNPNILNTGTAVSSDTEAVIEDDDTDSYCLPSLFDDDFCDSNDSALEDVKGMTAFSTSEAARAQDENKTPSEKPPTTVQNTRRPSSFISSFFGGFGGSASAAPYGYKSVIGSLEEFTKIEVLEGENAYGCEECTRREKLRVVLQRKRIVTKPLVDKVRKVAQQIEALPLVDSSSEQGSDDLDDRSRVKRENVQCKITTVTFQSSVSTARENHASEIVSSPVTSSESSSSICSDEDGELIVEEELETERGSSSNKISSLTRAEEDNLLKDVKVDVPTVRTTAEKRFMIRDAPSVLAIQLKRFMQTGFRGGLRKISGSVAFPVKLDITNFMDIENEEKDDHESDSLNVSKRKRKERGCSDTAKSEGYEYILTGVCVHGGSLSGGHYTAYVREGVESDSRGGWYFCNDSKISRATEKDVLNSEPYLLYYERV